MADIDETMTAEVTRLAREAQRLSSELAVIATTAEDLAEKGPSNWLVEDEGALNGALYFVSKLVSHTDQ